jgi:hypothetical protein
MEDDSKAMNKEKKHQQRYYDQHVKSLKPLVTGDSVRMCFPGEKVWSPGVCAGLVGPRSYEVKRHSREIIAKPVKSDDRIVDDLPKAEESTRVSVQMDPPQESAYGQVSHRIIFLRIRFFLCDIPAPASLPP